MVQGWLGDAYLVLFEEKAPSLEQAYGFPDALPEHRLVGLWGWDDFIVEDASGTRFTVPCVPLSQSFLKPLPAPIGNVQLQPDAQISGIKWYVKPIVFGGDPELGANVAWVTIEEHVQLVRWWNKRYLDARPELHAT